MNLENFQFDTWMTMKPICPYCGVEQGEDDLVPGMMLQCGDCGKVMKLEIDYSPSYITEKIDATTTQGKENDNGKAGEGSQDRKETDLS